MSADLNGHARDIDFEITEMEHLSSGARVAQSAQDSSDSCDQFAWAERLCDVVVSAELEALDAVGLRSFCRQKDYGDSGESRGLADLAAKFEAVSAGQHHV